MFNVLPLLLWYFIYAYIHCGSINKCFIIQHSQRPLWQPGRKTVCRTGRAAMPGYGERSRLAGKKRGYRFIWRPHCGVDNQICPILQRQKENGAPIGNCADVTYGNHLTVAERRLHSISSRETLSRNNGRHSVSGKAKKEGRGLAKGWYHSSNLELPSNSKAEDIGLLCKVLQKEINLVNNSEVFHFKFGIIWGTDIDMKNYSRLWLKSLVLIKMIFSSQALKQVGLLYLATLNPFDEAYIQPAAIKASGILSHLRGGEERLAPKKQVFARHAPSNRINRSDPSRWPIITNSPKAFPSLQLHNMGSVEVPERVIIKLEGDVYRFGDMSHWSDTRYLHL